MCYELRVMGLELKVRGCGFGVKNYRLWVKS